MERGPLSLSPDPILATHEFRRFEGQGKRQSHQGSIMTPEKSRRRTRHHRPDLTTQGGGGSGHAYLYIWNLTDMEKFRRLNEVPDLLRPTAPIYRTVYQLSRGWYTSENEIARYSRAGVVVGAGGARRCPRDSTRGLKSPARVASARFEARIFRTAFMFRNDIVFILKL